MDTNAAVATATTTASDISVDIPAVEKAPVAHTNAVAIANGTSNGTAEAIAVNGAAVTNGSVDNVAPEVKPRTVTAETVDVSPIATAVETVAAAVDTPIVVVEAVTVAVDTPIIAVEAVAAAVEAVTVAVDTPIVVEPVPAVAVSIPVPESAAEPIVAVASPVESVPELAAEPIVVAAAADTIVVAAAAETIIVAAPEPSPAQPEATPIAVVADIAVTPTPEPLPAPTGLLSLPEYVQQAIKEVAVREGFSFFETKIAALASGDGFVGDISKVTLTGVQTRNGIQFTDSDLSLIVKLPPTNPMRREFFAMKLFEREVFVYNDLLPAFARFQLSHGVKLGQAGFHSYPKCYHAHYDLAADQAVLILENLHAGGFAMENKAVSVSFEYARTVLEKLAELHGISLAMKHQEPALFERFRHLNDSTFGEGEQFKELNRTMMNKSAARAVQTLDDSETVLREKVLRATEKMLDEVDRYRGEHGEPYSVIIHGDCWVNNVMFKHESGQSRQVSLYDWQCTRYASPVLDIVYMIFLCTDAPLRARHYDDLIQAYHHSLRAQLERLNADVNELFPFTAMLRQLKTFGRYVLAAAIIVVPMLCTPKGDLPNMDDMVAKIGGDNWDGELFGVNAKSESAYRVRMAGLLRDMNKKGFF